MKEKIVKELKRLKIFDKTNFIILYGSQAKGTSTTLSDVDICLSFLLPKKERFHFRLKLLSSLPERYDIHVFEDLPLYVQKEVLGGKLLYCKDKEKLIERALEIIREFEDFELIYNMYVERSAV